MNKIENFLSRLEGVKETSGGWQALCPAHEDHNPSLSVSPGTNGQAVVFTCHAGCTYESIIESMGATWADICSDTTTKPIPTKKKKSSGFSSFEKAVAWIEKKEIAQLVSTHPYLKNGHEVFRIIRLDKEDGKKTYRPLHQLNGKWFISDPEGELPLYNYDGIASQDRIFVVEGEKCADAGLSIDLPVVTSSHGAGAAHESDWTPLRGKEVVIIPDTDQHGIGYAQEVLNILQKQDPKAIVKIIQLPDMEQDQDLYDYLERRDSVEPETLCEIINDLADVCNSVKPEPVKEASNESATESRPILISMDTVEPEEVDWLWYGKFALGKLATIAGEGGLGKSTITTDMAARISTGRPWPDDPMNSQPIGSTILLSAEDDPRDTIRPRLDRSGADPKKINFIPAIQHKDRETWFDIAEDLPHLETAIKKVGDCRLVIIDPISAYLGDLDSHNNSKVRGVLGPLSALANQYHVAIVMVTHMSKNDTSNAANKIMGSAAFVHAPRTVWAVTGDRGQEEEAKEGIDRRLVLMVKSNISFPYGLAYRIIDKKLEWETEPVKMTAKHFFSDSGEHTSAPAKYEAKQWLIDLLRSEGPMWSADIEAEAKGAGYCLKTVKTAKKELNIEAKRKGGAGKNGRWFWRLPIHKDQKPKEVSDNA